jgi:hypothetical protein
MLPLLVGWPAKIQLRRLVGKPGALIFSSPISENAFDIKAG